MCFSRKHSPQKPFLALPLGDTRCTFYFLWLSFVLSASWFGLPCWKPLLFFIIIIFLNHSPSPTQHSASAFPFILQEKLSTYITLALSLACALASSSHCCSYLISNKRLAASNLYPGAGQLPCPVEIQLHGGTAGMLTMPLLILSGSLKAFLPTQGRAGRFASKQM